MLLLLFFGTVPETIVVIFLESCFIIEYILRDYSNVQGLLLSCAWMGLPSLEIEKKETGVLGDVVVITTGRKKRAKDIVFQMRRQIVDAATVCTMAMCLSEDGYILQYILDFYIMAAVIFAVHSQIEDLT